MTKGDLYFQVTPGRAPSSGFALLFVLQGFTMLCRRLRFAAGGFRMTGLSFFGLPCFQWDF